MNCREANDSNASFRRYQKMKYAADNALRFLKNSVRYVILCRQVAQKQRIRRTLLPFGTGRDERRRYNRYRVTFARSNHGEAFTATPLLLLGLQHVQCSLSVLDDLGLDMRFLQCCVIRCGDALQRLNHE
jgi:hypothetical protein